jgi:hypothetical protein
LVQLEGLILSIQVVLISKGLRTTLCFPTEWSKTYLFLDPEVRQSTLSQPTSLKIENTLNEKGSCCLQAPDQGRMNLHFSNLKITISHKKKTPSIGIRVRLKDNLSRGNGIIIKIKEDRYPILVDWGRSQTWHSNYELYCFDELGNIMPPNIEACIFQAAQLGRASLLTRLIERQHN